MKYSNPTKEFLQNFDFRTLRRLNGPLNYFNVFNIPLKFDSKFFQLFQEDLIIDSPFNLDDDLIKSLKGNWFHSPCILQEKIKLRDV